MQKIKKRFIVSLLIASMGLVTGCSVKDNTVSNNDETKNDGKLQVLKSDAQVDHDSLMSQIKADKLVKNNGYLDDDEVSAIIELSSSPLIDYYLGDTQRYSSVGDYAISSAGRLNAKAITKEQNRLITKMRGSDLIKSVDHTYNTIINAVAVTTTYGNFMEISEMVGVKNAILSDTYNLPQAVQGQALTDPVTNDVNVYDTGIFDASEVNAMGYDGEHTAVAILDSGFDCSHTVFQDQPSDPLLLPEDVERVLEATNAYSTTPNLQLSDVSYSTKIPFVYDYADSDSDVNPFDSEHGTHVAGIIGGQDSEITGVAPHTQLVLMKVFPDLDDGANTDDILAALDDAVTLGVDAINMSLGSSCGFTREVDEANINAIYDKIKASGVSLVTAASNSYSSSYGSEQGNTNKVTNPDSATVGSPSTYEASLSVASISGTKSQYIVGNDDQVIFFNQSNNLASRPYDFFDMLGLPDVGEVDYEYVTVPGVGMLSNYSAIDVTGKIALVRRGTTTFEEKAQIANQRGAAGIIIYNNTSGDILMSMGKNLEIPTVSISRDDGMALASQRSGKLTMSKTNLAGPFMSDFSSWGPTPDLKLKPEITAHGGNIKSSIPGGGYDELSGTSMASPNMCGVIVLIRQYLKVKYPDYDYTQIAPIANQLLMSTATIALNQEGNPYSPRKQGAGLASLFNAVNTGAYITVDGNTKTKLELGDDKDREGVYTMNFNIKNISNRVLSYDVSVAGMTESVSTADSDFVAEKGQLLDGAATSIRVLSGGELSGTKVSVAAFATCNVEVVYRLTDANKKLIDDLFPYGMFVEGFVKLDSDQEDGIDLNAPFLAFYGDWTEAPMFDQTYFDVDEEANDGSIDEDDKLKADVYATIPYGTYFGNYLLPMGSYIYDMDTTTYDAISASEEHAAMTSSSTGISGITTIYAGLLRNAKSMQYTITDVTTGEEVYSYIDYNANKSYSLGGGIIPYFDILNIRPTDLGLVNNKQYQFTMTGLLDYGDGGYYTNANNTFSFKFYMDDESPIVTNATYEKVYDRVERVDRYYLNLTVYDNHYVQSIHPVIFTSTSSYTPLTENPIPVYGSAKGTETTVRFEITDYLEVLYSDAIVTSSLAFQIDDYAMNSNIFLCQLPGSNGSFNFTTDGTASGQDLTYLSTEVGEPLDIVPYLSTTDSKVDADKDYMKYLTWSTTDSTIAEVREGVVYGYKAGRVILTVHESLYGESTSIIINIREDSSSVALRSANIKAANGDDITLQDLQFTYFRTLFAYPNSGDYSEIGSTGSTNYFSESPNLSFYPGESLQIFYKLTPWYLPTDRYELTWSSSNPAVATVDQNGVVRGLKEGSTTIRLNITVDGRESYIMAYTRATIKNEFIIEDRVLTAYKGIGGDVVIPDDEGILTIGSFAFANYNVDDSIIVGDDDWDANKIPVGNAALTSVVIPDGVEEIQRYAFYNCTNLEKVTIPGSVKYIRDNVFYNDAKLESVTVADGDTSGLIAIGAQAFKDCVKLSDISTKGVYALGNRAFDGCTALTTADVSSVRNSGREVFRNCVNLSDVTFSDDTVLAYGMFVNTGIESLELGMIRIPDYCFANCASLESVVIKNDLISIGVGAFSGCSALESVAFNGAVDTIYEQAFYNCQLLTTIDLPNNKVKIGNYAFYMCENLEAVYFGQMTEIEEFGTNVFAGTALSSFGVDPNSVTYSTSDDGTLLYNFEKSMILMAAANNYYGDLVINCDVGDSAFSGITTITGLTFTKTDVAICSYAFAGCSAIEFIILPEGEQATIYPHAFNSTISLETVTNLENVLQIGAYAFANTTSLVEPHIGDGTLVGEGAFFRSGLAKVYIGNHAQLGLGAFQGCSRLVEVVLDEDGGIIVGPSCFANDTSLRIIDMTKLGETLHSEAFYGCSAIRTANLTYVKNIGNYAFADCTGLEVVTVPAAEIIGEGAFSRYQVGAPAISQIVLPETLTTIGDGAFIGCTRLTSVVIPNSVTSLGAFAFAYCSQLGSVTLSNKITDIGTYTFAGCTNLATINLDKIVTVGDYAFTSSTALDNVDLSSLKSVGIGAFASTTLRTVTGLGELTHISDYGFQNCLFTTFNAPKIEYIGIASFYGATSLTTFTFGDKLSYLGERAFFGASSLSAFVYNGSQTADVNDYVKLVDGAIYTYLPNGHLQFTSYPAAKVATTLEVLEGTFRIDSGAANENKYLRTVTLPDSLKAIGNFAFYNCFALREVIFKSYQAPVLESTIEDISLSTTAPGYDLLHPYFDMFGEDVYYCNFISLVGMRDSIKITVPSNEGITGYDNLIYRVFFGSELNRSEYVARDSFTVSFLLAMEKIPSDIESITLKDEQNVTDAVTYYNSMTQNLTDFGYSESDVTQLVTRMNDANKKIKELKLAKASDALKALQERIDALPSAFSISDIEELRSLQQEIQGLALEDRLILDLTKYNVLVEGLDSYIDSVITPNVDVIKGVNSNIYYYVSLISGVALIAMVMLLAPRLGKQN